MYGNQEEKKKDWLTCPHVTGMILLIWFGVTGVLTYIVPCARYYASEDPPVGERTKVHGKFDALHWLTTLGPLIAGVGACLAGTRVNNRVICFLCSFGGLLWLTCYIAYVILFFLSSEWKRTYDMISFDDFQKLNQKWMEAPAEIWIYGTAILHSSKSRPGECETAGHAVVKTENSQDFSAPLKRGYQRQSHSSEDNH